MDQLSAAHPVRRLDGISRLCLVLIALILVLAAIYIAQDVVVPLAAALVINLILAPVVRGLRRLRVPAAVAAATLTLGVTAGLLYGTVMLGGPLESWVDRFPSMARQLQYEARLLKRPVEAVQEASKQVDSLTKLADDKGAAKVVVQEPTLLERIAMDVPMRLLQVGTCLIILFFLLWMSDAMWAGMVQAMPTPGSRSRMRGFATQMQQDISNYLATITCINIGLGAALAGALYLLGMPNPLLWGVLAAVLNYVPYAGPMVVCVVLFFVGYSVTPSLTAGLSPVGAYLVLNVFESQILTPGVLGRRLTLNPLVIFLSVVFWTWLLGLVGAVLAVPLTIAIKIAVDHIDGLEPLGNLIGAAEPLRRPDRRRSPADLMLRRRAE